jgi:hypothetical protein
MMTRREVLCRIGGGIGAVGLSTVLADAGFLAPNQATNPLAPRAPHFPAKAKRLIFLFMNGGPSHVDTFDFKPMLAARAGEPVPASAVSRSANCSPRSAAASTTSASCVRSTPTIPITSPAS